MTKAEHRPPDGVAVQGDAAGGERSRNVARTCRHFGISRQAFYRWKRRFDAHGAAGLCGSAQHAAPVAHGHAAGGRQQDSVPPADLPLRPGQDCRLSEALSSALAGRVVGAPHPGPARDEPPAGQSEASGPREALAAVREAPAGPPAADRREVSRADPRHAEAALSVHRHR